MSLERGGGVYSGACSENESKTTKLLEIRHIEGPRHSLGLLMTISMNDLGSTITVDQMLLWFHTAPQRVSP